MTGRATFATSGEPASGVTILVLPGRGTVLLPRKPLLRVSTDRAGRYRAGGLAPGPYILRVDAPGLAADDCIGFSDGDADLLDRDFLLAPASTIEGRVIDVRSGEPVPNFPVRARTASTFTDLRAKTDTSGVFRIEGLSAGLVHLFPGSNMGWLCQPTGIPDACRVIPVGPGVTVSGIDLPVSWTGRIEGRVIDATGGPVPGATVTVESTAPGLHGDRRDAITDSDGRYHLTAVVPGVPMRLEVIADGFVSAERSLVSPRDTTRPLQIDVSLEIRKQTAESNNPFTRNSAVVPPRWDAALEGTVRISDNGALPDLFRVRVCPGWKNKAFGMYTDWECKDAHHSTLRRAATPFGKHDSGRFVRAELPPGPMRVEISAAGLITEILDVDLPEHDIASVEVTLSPGATVQGTVVDADGKRVAGAVIYVSSADDADIPDDFATNVIRGIRGRAIAVSDGEGRFSSSGIRPGKRKLIALVPGLEPGRSATLELQAGQMSAGHVLRVLAGGRIVGRLLRVGKPAAGQVAKLYAGNELISVTDTNGEFVFAGLPPGKYTLVFPGAGWHPPEEPRLSVLVRRGETNKKQIDLGTLGGLTGRLWQKPVGQYGNSTGYSVRLLVPGSRTFSELVREGIDPHRSIEYRVGQVGFAYVFEPGRFHIPNLAPGRYLLELHGPMPLGNNSPRDCAATTAVADADPESPQPSVAELDRRIDAVCGAHETLIAREIEIRPSETLELDLSSWRPDNPDEDESVPSATWEQERANLTEMAQDEYTKLHRREMKRFYEMRDVAISNCLRKFGRYCSCHQLSRSGFWIDPEGRPRDVWVSGIGVAETNAAQACREKALSRFRFPPPPPGKTVQISLKAHATYTGFWCRGSRWSPECINFFKYGPGQIEENRKAGQPPTPAQAANQTWFAVMDGRKGIHDCLEKTGNSRPEETHIEFQVPSSGGHASGIRLDPETARIRSARECIITKVITWPLPEYRGRPFDVRVLFPKRTHWRLAEVQFRGISPDGRRDGLLATIRHKEDASAGVGEELQAGSREVRSLGEPVITGTVLDHTGSPVAGASVRLEKKMWFSSDEWYRTTTGGDGTFRFDKPLAGVASLHVSHPDHAEPAPLVFKLEEGKGTETRFVMLEKPGLSVQGQLTFRGHPLSNERIIADCSNQGRYAITDADGQFMLRNLKHGRCRLHVFTRGWSPRELERTDASGNVLPGVPHGVGSVWVDVKGDQPIRVDIDVASLASVSGRVDRRGSDSMLKVQLALPGEYVEDDRKVDYLTVAWVDRDGEFSIPYRFQAGEYELRLVQEIEGDCNCIEHIDLQRETVHLGPGEDIRVVHLTVPAPEKMESLLEKCR